MAVGCCERVAKTPTPEVTVQVEEAAVNEPKPVVVGGPLDGAELLVSKDVTKNVCWWGFGQWYKWRWNVTHIDLGPVSVYELKCFWFWRLVSILIKPLRMYYSWRIRSARKKDWIGEGL